MACRPKERIAWRNLGEVNQRSKSTYAAWTPFFKARSNIWKLSSNLLSPASFTRRAVRAGTLAGETITAKLTKAPGNDAPIGGLKVVAANGWFAARPSGTENIYKICAESFKDERHLEAIIAEAQKIVSAALAG